MNVFYLTIFLAYLTIIYKMDKEKSNENIEFKEGMDINNYFFIDTEPNEIEQTPLIAVPHSISTPSDFGAESFEAIEEKSSIFFFEYC